MKKSHIPWLVVFLVILLDQALKIYVKLNFYENQIMPIWDGIFKLHFVENEGMAFGMTIAGNYGKLILTTFRLLAVSAIGYYVHQLVKNDASRGLIVCMSLILAGAFGNIVDSVFYGVVFSDSYGRIAELFPADGGYAPLLHGKVVDMISIHVYKTDMLPRWIPKLGGKPFVLFDPIFNLADAAITMGVFVIFIFQKRFFTELPQMEDDEEEEEVKEEDHNYDEEVNVAGAS